MSLFSPLFLNLSDPRSSRNQIYPFEYMVLVTLCACMAGETSFSGIADYASLHHDEFSKYFDLPSYAPHPDTFRYLFESLDYNQFYFWFEDFTAVLVSGLSVCEGIAIDGKTIRHSTNNPLHIVNAWCTGNRLLLGFQKVDDQSNEITAIPLLLKTLDVKGRVITMDAMGTQRDICQQIIEAEGDYCVALKKNQPSLYQDVATYFQDKELDVATFEHYDKGHGRIEKRVCRVFERIDWLKSEHQWPGLQTIVQIRRTTIKGSKETSEVSYYITSLKATPERLLTLIRDHWHIENRLHWVLDVTFNQDKACIRTENSALNMDIIRKIALNILNREKNDKQSIRSMQRSCWKPQNAIKLLLKFYHS